MHTNYPSDFSPRVELQSSPAQVTFRAVDSSNAVMAVQGPGARVRARPAPGVSQVSLLVQRHGTARIGVGSRTVDATVGDMVLIHTANAVCLRMDGPYQHTAFLMADMGFSLGLIRGGTPALRSELVDAVLALADSDDADVSTIIALFRRVAEPNTAQHGPVRLRRALLYIAAHATDPELCPESVARAQGVSQRWLDRLVARQGITLSQAIQVERLSAAWKTLGENPAGSVLDAALAAGFPSASALSHAFRKHYGMTPTARRNRSRVAGLSEPQTAGGDTESYS